MPDDVLTPPSPESVIASGAEAAEAPVIPISDVLDAPNAPGQAEEAAAPEGAQQTDEAFAQEYAQRELGAQPQGTAAPAASPADTQADLLRRIEEQGQVIEQLRAQMGQSRQPQLDPGAIYRAFPHLAPPPPPSPQQRIEQRIDALAREGNWDPNHPQTRSSLRMFAQEQIAREDMQGQMQRYQWETQQMQQQAIISSNQREMDRAFFNDPVLAELSRGDEKLGAQLYESAFAIQLAQGGQGVQGARAAVAQLRGAIDRATEARVKTRLENVQRQSQARPIAQSTGRTASLAATPPGQGIKFKPRVASNAVNEAAEAANRALKAAGIE